MQPVVSPSARRARLRLLLRTAIATAWREGRLRSQATSNTMKHSLERLLRSLADAIWPSLPLPADADADGALRVYWSTSGADLPNVPGDVMRAITQYMQPASCRQQLLLLLELMQWRFAMLPLAGALCLVLRWPFVCTYAELPLARRQAILHAWQLSRLPLFAMAFKGLRSVVAAVVLTTGEGAAASEKNPLHAAPGYVPGDALPRDAKQQQHAPGAEADEVLASAVIDVPRALDAAGGDAGALLRYFKRRGLSVVGEDDAQQQHAATTTTTTIELDADAVVVGSGAGGSTAAAVLAAAGLRVVVVEKGEFYQAYALARGGSEGAAFRARYEAAGFCTTSDAALSVLAGATIGGGTKINWNASLRPPAHVRREWAAPPHNLTALDSPEFLASLDAVCARLGVGAVPAERNGPNGVLMDGLRALGVHAEQLPRNCASARCSGYCSLGCRSGHKASADATFLADAARRGAAVLTGVAARRVLLTPLAMTTGDHRMQRAVGVELTVVARNSGEGNNNSRKPLLPLRIVVRAPRVFASAGSLHTPALLLRSGVAVGGSVGANLRLHPATGVYARFARNPARNSGGSAVNMHDGVMMDTFSTAVANWNHGGYGAMVSVPSLHPGMLAAIAPWAPPGASLRRDLLALNDLACAVVFARDVGGGRVTLGAGEEGAPLLSYWPCPATRRAILDGLELAVRAYVAAGAVEVVVPHAEPLRFAVPPAAAGGGDNAAAAAATAVDAFVAKVRAAGVERYRSPLLSAHQMGSCRMGSSRSTSACDPSGEVWDVTGLFVADASAFPTASGVNPMITAMGLAHFVATRAVAAAKKAAAT